LREQLAKDGFQITLQAATKLEIKSGPVQIRAAFQPTGVEHMKSKLFFASLGLTLLPLLLAAGSAEAVTCAKGSNHAGL